MSKTLQWIIGISAIIIALAFAFSAVWPFVAPNLSRAGYGSYGMMGGVGMTGMMNNQGMMNGQAMMNGNSMMGMTLAPARCAGVGGQAMMNSSLSSTMHILMLDIFAQKLDLTRAELDGRLADGETLAQIAATQDISWAAIHQAVMDETVAAGYLTQAQATQMLAKMGDSINCPFTQATPTP